MEKLIQELETQIGILFLSGDALIDPSFQSEIECLRSEIDRSIAALRTRCEELEQALFLLSHDGRAGKAAEAARTKALRAAGNFCCHDNARVRPSDTCRFPAIAAAILEERAKK